MGDDGVSDPNLAHRTAVEVTISGADVTSSIRAYLKSLVYTDNETDEADDLKIQLHDRESVWPEKWLNDTIDAAATSGSAGGNFAVGDTVQFGRIPPSRRLPMSWPLPTA